MEVFSHHLLSDTICGKMKKKIVRSKKFFFSSYFLFKMVELFWRNRHECVFPFFVYILLCLILSSKRFLTAFKNSVSLFAHKFSLCSSQWAWNDKVVLVLLTWISFFAGQIHPFLLFFFLIDFKIEDFVWILHSL